MNLMSSLACVCNFEGSLTMSLKKRVSNLMKVLMSSCSVETGASDCLSSTGLVLLSDTGVVGVALLAVLGSNKNLILLYFKESVMSVQ